MRTVWSANLCTHVLTHACQLPKINWWKKWNRQRRPYHRCTHLRWNSKFIWITITRCNTIAPKRRDIRAVCDIMHVCTLYKYIVPYQCRRKTVYFGFVRSTYYVGYNLLCLTLLLQCIECNRFTHFFFASSAVLTQFFVTVAQWDRARGTTITTPSYTFTKWIFGWDWVGQISRKSSV